MGYAGHEIDEGSLVSCCPLLSRVHSVQFNCVSVRCEMDTVSCENTPPWTHITQENHSSLSGTRLLSPLALFFPSLSFFPFFPPMAEIQIEQIFSHSLDSDVWVTEWATSTIVGSVSFVVQWWFLSVCVCLCVCEPEDNAYSSLLHRPFKDANSNQSFFSVLLKTGCFNENAKLIQSARHCWAELFLQLLDIWLHSLCV